MLFIKIILFGKSFKALNYTEKPFVCFKQTNDFSVQTQLIAERQAEGGFKALVENNGDHAISFIQIRSGDAFLDFCCAFFGRAMTPQQFFNYLFGFISIHPHSPRSLPALWSGAFVQLRAGNGLPSRRCPGQLRFLRCLIRSL